MGGLNPYIEPAETKLPEQKYKITFLPMQETVEVDPEKLPYTREGLPGSILEIAQGHDIDIDHACGGVVACSTCHVIVREGRESCPEATEAEEDMLDNAPGVCPDSRLACQAVPDGTRDIVVEIPDWNRNLVKEGHH
ncbi:MAG: 2Fe-2S iron-sulfur cluster binding domain-containing protein [Planctomycetes bacterium]|nr:2Fe-2S iron-sulfur cluster binding domain-containing protein [Planctomycetota bacterium]MCB9903263.1 2Fe-2S iron-sulfur cluster binding domain-containing protein [Planctomycetota bacterium]